MRDAIDGEPATERVVDIVENSRANILRAYQESLTTSGRPYPVSRRAVEQAEVVLDDACRRMARDRTQEAGGDAVRVSSALIRTAVHAVAVDLPPCPDPGHDEYAAHAASELAAAIHEAIVDRLTSAADGYTGYLVDQLHRSHVEERRRVSRDLHDLVAHSIAVALQNLELSVLHRQRDEQRATAKFEAALDNLRETLDMLRAISRDLRRSVAVGGLTSALRSYLHDAALEQVVEFRVAGDESNVPVAVQGELFLVLREALRNAHLHGAATRIRLRVDIRPEGVRATINDNGRGFPAVLTPDETAGIGITSMRERIALLGGVVDVRSVPGRGTRVSVSVPLTKAWDEPED